MNSYLPLVVGGVVTIAILVMIFTPIECFVMENYPIQKQTWHPPQLDVVAGMSVGPDGHPLFSKKVFSNLEESEIIIVEDPPNSPLDALLFWTGEKGITVFDPRRVYVSYHVECNDVVSRTVQWMFPSMFPNTPW